MPLNIKNIDIQGVQKNFPLLDNNNSRGIQPTKLVYIFFGKLKHVVT